MRVELRKVTLMPQVTIRTEINGREEVMTEYLCDWTDCPNVAVEMIGVIRELRVRAAMCEEHAALFHRRKESSGS
jgi:hypothetical protein